MLVVFFYDLFIFRKKREKERARIGEGPEGGRERERKQTPQWAGNPTQGSIPRPWDCDRSRNQESEASLTEPLGRPCFVFFCYSLSPVLLQNKLFLQFPLCLELRCAWRCLLSWTEKKCTRLPPSSPHRVARAKVHRQHKSFVYEVNSFWHFGSLRLIQITRTTNMNHNCGPCTFQLSLVRDWIWVACTVSKRFSQRT